MLWPPGSGVTSRELPASRVEQLAELVAAALTATAHHEHLQAQHLGRERAGFIGQHGLHDQQPGVRRGRPAAGRQDPARGVVVPVVQDVAEHVDVGAGRDAGHEVTGDELDALSRGCAADHLGQVEHHAPRLRRGGEQGPQQRAVPAAHVHDAAALADVRPLRDLPGDHRGYPAHRAGERGALVRVIAVVVPDGLAQSRLGDRFPAQRLGQQFQRAQLPGGRQHQREVPERPGSGAQARTGLGGRDQSRRGSFHQPQYRGRAQQPVQQLRFGAGDRGQVGDATRAGREVLGDVQPGQRPQDVRGHRAVR
jgi:hypothetical protein